MPFKSEAQRKYMHKNLPEIAQRWEREYGREKLPVRITAKAANLRTSRKK